MPVIDRDLLKIPEIAERFNQRTSERDGECWEWTGNRAPAGYGILSYKGKAYRAHRISWQMHNPHRDILPGELVCHTCDNPPCCNPSHLFVGTAKDNVRDMMEKRRHRSHAANHCANGHEWTQENTRISNSGQRVCRACDRERRSRRDLKAYQSKWKRQRDACRRSVKNLEVVERKA